MRSSAALGILCFIVSVALSVPCPARAQWVNDGAIVSAEAGNQYAPAAAEDGAGGVIVAWLDNRGPYSRQIFAQRLSASGLPMWAANGIPVCLGPGSNGNPHVIADGQGGAIITWHGSPVADDDILAQRIDANGAALWDSNGVSLCAASGEQLDPVAVSDGAGGAIVVWQDLRDDAQGDVYAQRVDANGTPRWLADGIALCSVTGQQLNIALATDQAGGAIVAWEDYRIGPSNDVFAQRVDSSGVVQWAADGLPVCDAPSYQSLPAVVTDQAQGALVAWQDLREAPAVAIYAQRLDAGGATQWDSLGVRLHTPADDATNPRAIPDGAGGAIVSWQSQIGGHTFALVQRVSASGAMLFDTGGVRLTDAPGDEVDPVIVADGGGGAIVAWTDSRDYLNFNKDIYAQRVDAGGTLRWGHGGETISTAPNMQITPAIVPGTPGSALVAWADFRSNSNYDVYANAADSSRVLAVDGSPSAVAGLRAIRPNPTSGRATIEFDLASPQRLSIEVFDIAGRRIRAISGPREFAAGSHSVAWDGASGDGGAVRPGVYNVRVSGPGILFTRRVVVVR